MSIIRIIRGTISDAVQQNGQVIRCTVNGLEGETIEDVEVIQNYGHSAVPADGSECVAVQFGHRVIAIAGVDRSLLPNMSTGDVAVHSDKNQYMIMKSSGGIDIRTAGTVTVYAQTVRLGEGDMPTPPLIPVSDGVVTPKCACSYMGMHAQGSTAVLAKT